MNPGLFTPAIQMLLCGIFFVKTLQIPCITAFHALYLAPGITDYLGSSTRDSGYPGYKRSRKEEGITQHGNQKSSDEEGSRQEEGSC
jgi:hypothetical protein